MSALPQRHEEPPAPAPAEAPAPAAPDPLLVRLGLRYFRHLSQRAARVESGDAIHFLNPEERAALKRIQRGTILRAAAAGALSTIVAAIAEVLAHPLLGPDPERASWSDQARFWGIVGGATVLASVIEIGFLYWDGLRSVHRLAREAGLDLFPDEDDDTAVAGAMARAALELPNPSTRLFGVNPWREASRLRLLAASLVYKAKVSVTNFAAKALVRRMLGRAFVRTWLPFVAVPITAGWNALVCWHIMREARVRAMGRSAAHEMIGLVFERAPALSDAGRAAAVRAVASSIVRTEDMHPNLVAVLMEVLEHTRLASRRDAKAVVSAPDDAGDLDDPGTFLARLRALPGAEQRVVLQVLGVASVIDGRLTRAEKRLLREAREACGASTDLAGVERLRRAFVSGDAILREQIETL